MRNIPPGDLQDIGTRLFDAVGSPHEESQAVSEVLVRASLMGHDSHGVMRFGQYVRQVRGGEIVPGAPFEIIKDTAAIAIVDGHNGWGVVIGRKAMDLAIAKARLSAVGTVVVRGCHHVGRLGEYPPRAAAQQMVGLAYANSPGGHGHMAPWGGIDARLAPNTIAWAAPSGEKWPMMMDIATCVWPEGKLRMARYRNQPLPEGVIIDADGNPTTDPARFYGPPPGALLPFGGIVGHKGYALTILPDLLGGLLSGAGIKGRERAGTGNGLFFQALNITDFTPMEDFLEEVEVYARHIKSSRRAPGIDEILLPGEPEHRISLQREQNGIPVDDAIWEEIQRTAQELSVEV